MMDKNQPLLLPLLYLGNIQYWSKLINHDCFILNDAEHYPKGTFRNRCHLGSSQGVLRLSIPLVGGKHAGQNYTEVSIDQNENWQKHHWQSICTCYGSAPFFHHYAAKLKVIYETPSSNLWEWNLHLTKLIMSWLEIDKRKCTLLSENENATNYLDLSQFFSPKPRFNKADEYWKVITYPQIFERTLGFLPNCSILDIIFCQGPYALNILTKSYLSAK